MHIFLKEIMRKSADLYINQRLTEPVSHMRLLLTLCSFQEKACIHFLTRILYYNKLNNVVADILEFQPCKEPSNNHMQFMYWLGKSCLLFLRRAIIHFPIIGSLVKNCGDGHLGFPIHTLQRYHTMTIHDQYVFNSVCCFYEGILFRIEMWKVYRPRWM